MVAIIVLFWVLCAGFSAYIASQKNRGAGNWFALGMVFGVFALVAIMAVPALEDEPDEPLPDLRSRRGW